MAASRCGHTEAVEKLLARPDIDVNLQDKDGITALDIAKKKRFTDVINMFNVFMANKAKAKVENDLKTENERVLADVRNINDKQGLLSIEQIEKFVSYPNLKDIVNESLSNDDDESDIGKILLYIDVNEGDNPARVVKIIRTLQKAGYNFNKKYSDGRTLSDLATFIGNKDMLMMMTVLAE